MSLIMVTKAFGSIVMLNVEICRFGLFSKFLPEYLDEFKLGRSYAFCMAQIFPFSSYCYAAQTCRMMCLNSLSWQPL